jgi:carbamoyl-phosphate synthase small subunit
MIEEKSAKLILEDDSVFEGTSFGFQESVSGEVVFCTGMVGYPESLTDPSYKGQILTLTYPLIGNYGMPDHQKMIKGLPAFYEAESGQVSGLVVSDYSHQYHHWNADTSLAQWLYNQKIPAIAGIDTRALTKRLREKGTMLGKIILDDKDVPLFDPQQHNLVARASIDKPQRFGKGGKRIMVIDCGGKRSIVKELINRNVEVLMVPWNYPALDEKVDGVLISNGPGDPKTCTETIEQVQGLINNGIPTFGICLGHQILSLAIGLDTFKMKYGHRSQNQPVMHLETSKCYITSQNHGYVTDTTDLPAKWKPSFINLNDETSEGLMHASGLFSSVQFHPEAAPGPNDTAFLFDEFIGRLA